MTVYEVRVQGAHLRGTVIMENWQGVLDEVQSHQENADDGYAPTIVIRPVEMTREEYEALPEHDGW